MDEALADPERAYRLATYSVRSRELVQLKNLAELTLNSAPPPEIAQLEQLQRLHIGATESNRIRGLPAIARRLKKATIYARGNRLPKAEREALKGMRGVYL